MKNITYHKFLPIKRLEIIKRPAQPTNLMRPIQKKQKTTKLPTTFSHLPPPDDGVFYKPKEIIDIYKTMIKKRKISQTRFAQHLITNA